ncbi:LexA family transcriptional regulator [Herbaspirillum sp. CAH-3]|uniref:XRE family transcriptional regulator n=1 Tax=Herbaspirillum sp. CAH-3 TaxID=2605746 RepID=UPI0012ACFFB6|nr:LexA family transcriptional regulator [Herbaspirillum sp. CAH-3]MRT27609.1 LexA family transcriptional regulator [Herbaspirillum sp. CAH-3]
MSNIAARLDQAMSAAGFPSQSALARASGVPQPTINRILKNSGKGHPEAATVRKLAEACNVSFNWLNEGLGEMGRDAVTPSAKVQALKALIASTAPAARPDIVEIPVYKLNITAGITGFQAELDESEFAIPVAVTQRWLDQHGLAKEQLVATTVRGDSMEETLSDGDTVIINTKSVRPRDNKIFAVNFGGQAVVKRLISDFGRWFLVSDNSDQKRYHREECSTENCILIGEVVMAQRNFLRG